MRLHGLDCLEACARTADKVLFDLDFNFVEHRERARSHKLYRRLNDAGDGVLDWRQQVIGELFFKTLEKIREGFARYEFNFGAEQRECSFFAEGSALALERYSWFSQQSVQKLLPQLR